MPGLLIGEVARRTGVSAPTIRYYESIGLLSPPHRSEAGYRRYTSATLEELAFVRKAQTLGFSLDEIGEVLRLTRSGEAPCSRVLSIAHQHLAAVTERIARLERFRDQLASELAKWDGVTEPTCEGLCRIVATVASTGPRTSDTSLEPRTYSRKSSSSVRTG
jgi:DNA-binding transcriptional MerR regulator